MRLRNSKRTLANNRTNKWSSSSSRTEITKNAAAVASRTARGGGDINKDADVEAIVRQAAVVVSQIGIGTGNNQDAAVGGNANNASVENANKVSGDKFTNDDGEGPESDTNEDDGEDMANDGGEDEVDRTLRVTVDAIGKTFPSPASYDEVDIGDVQDLYGQASWSDRDDVLVEDLLDEFVQEEGWLPEGVPLAATRTWCWHNQLCCRDADLAIGHNRTLRGVRTAFASNVIDGFNRIQTWIAPPDDVDNSMFLFRTYTERQYLTNMSALTADTIEGWRGTKGVDLEAYVWRKPLLVADFRYFLKDSRFWNVWVKNERRLRSKRGRVIPR